MCDILSRFRPLQVIDIIELFLLIVPTVTKKRRKSMKLLGWHNVTVSRVQKLLLADWQIGEWQILRIYKTLYMYILLYILLFI